MSATIFAANWKMHLGPDEAGQFLDLFLARYRPRPERSVWFFPPAVSLTTVASRIQGRHGLLAGAQDVHWDDAGAFTGEMSVPMAAQAGAQAALVGHSERRHLFGETDEDTGRKVRAVLRHGLRPVLCVGETLEERERGVTLTVIERQLGVLQGIEPDALARLVIAYEPVWAIGTGRNASPADAARVHAAIGTVMGRMGAGAVAVLYGGSVRPENAQALVCTPGVNGLLVGGASTDPQAWGSIVETICN